MSTTALQGLLDYLYGTLSPSNMRWVGEHLVMQADKVENPDLKPYTMDEINAMLDEAEADFEAGKGIPDEVVMREMDEEIAHMEAEERAYWAQSVERDLADMAEGKTTEYVSGDEFWSRFEQAAMKHYEDVPAEV